MTGLSSYLADDILFRNYPKIYPFVPSIYGVYYIYSLITLFINNGLVGWLDWILVLIFYFKAATLFESKSLDPPNDGGLFDKGVYVSDYSL